MKRSRINPVSKKQEIKNTEWKALGRYLTKHRAKGRCEIPRCEERFKLSAHHIIFRRFNLHNAANCLIVCGHHHSHHEWGSGIPMSAEQALVFVVKLNKEHDIDPNITGSSIK